jgi:hypothetical protein
MLEGLLSFFSGGTNNNSAARRDNPPVLYINKTTLAGGRKGYLVRNSETERGVFYPAINDAAEAIAKMYARKPNSCISTLREPFKITSMTRKEVDEILLACEMSAGGKPRIAGELRQVGSYSEPKIPVKKLQTAGK